MSINTSTATTATITPSPRPPFPLSGSTLTNNNGEIQYFSLGKLGRGTFCEIYKCIDLSFHHQQHQSKTSNTSNTSNTCKNNKSRLRICAAKIECSNFANCGVLDGEANVLRFLNEYMDNQTPIFCDYIQPQSQQLQQLQSQPLLVESNHNLQQLKLLDQRQPFDTSGTALLTAPTTPIKNIKHEEELTNNNHSSNNNTTTNNNIRAIIMEYLPGEDMHVLRDRHSQISSKKAMKKFQQQQQSSSSPSSFSPQYYRRLNISDSVYLCADVILPLIQSMHNCGMIHRDIKPSNCIRVGTTDSNKQFKLVDFGLSKSFIVPQSSSYADENYKWDKVWQIPENIMNNNDQLPTIGYMRKEREYAEFRGTSMYASLRVHQGFDFCRRDDIWGLMYVFCDLVSGGLPWMRYAANRDRASCQRMKEWVHGERLAFDGPDDNGNIVDAPAGGDESHNSAIHNINEKLNKNISNNSVNGGIRRGKITSDHIEEMLKGIDYHISKYERDMITKKQKQSNSNSSTKPYSKPLPPLAPPLEMSKDQVKINALRKAFDHLAELKYADEPDYNLIKNCLKEFCGSEFESKGVRREDMEVYPINWNQPSQHEIDKRKWEKMGNRNNRGDLNDTNPNKMKMTQALSFVDTDDLDPLIQVTINEAENSNQLNLAQQEIISGDGGIQVMENYLSRDSLNYSEIQDMQRLPLQLQFHLAQVEYNALHPSTIPIHLALRDWMYLASTLVNDKWDTAKYERGNHRSNDDGYRRQVLMRISQQCLDAAKPFRNFCDRDCFYYNKDDGENDKNMVDGDVMSGNGSESGHRKRRKIFANDANGDSSGNDCFLAFSKLLCSLKALIENEKERLTAPPPVLSMK